MFDDKEMQAWEVKPVEGKTWDAAKEHFVTLYKSKEKFNAERLTRTEGYASAHSIVSNHFFSGIPSTVLSSTGTMSPSDQHNMMDYTNSLEAALDTTKEHAAFLTTTQNQLLQKLERQQEDLLTQTTRFMTLLNARTPTLATPTTATAQPRPARNAWTRQNPRFPRHCNSCNKDAVHHEDDDCYTLDKNKDKRPQWYVARK
jgi:hypothetical protein